ncbi:MAG: hypothetical protein HYV03_03760 [Deltaproteobacteria bacterium]|nr:hypothetical protein [Deltaproteobacteria bacterium]
MRSLFAALFLVILLMSHAAIARGRHVSARDANLGVTYVGMKAKGGWTAVVIAIENQGTRDATFECCEAFLENAAGFAVPALGGDEMAVLIRNKAKTAATIGALIGAGLGIAGAVADVDELVYAAVGIGVASGVTAVAGEASADKERRSFVIDNVFRARSFPAGLKVAGVVYFPPRKRWPDSKQAQAIHLTYKLGGMQHRVAAQISQK